MVEITDSLGQRATSAITEPENNPLKAPFTGNPTPSRVSTQEASEVRKHHEPANSAGANGARMRAKTPGSGGGKTTPNTAPAIKPR
eukprot:CAMPEP_0169275668 /NCGR_PEP_ID=MMETSP1016-20121227/52525_1 /TAXON_ID=342587 /ORGANISM="Karlodinium micrum, Strain CCMP2283" /LENGTH=85 /DNA_ID=CAMNT_0009362599 /DNA_START=122 /DNA_END=379 /DNA_ORIENTATION=-